MPKGEPDAPPCEFVIEGTTRDGKPFRPSDWAERLCGVTKLAELQRVGDTA